MSSVKKDSLLKVFSFKAMGSPCKIHVYLSRQQELHVAQAAIQLVHQLEAKYSRYQSTSILSKMNKDGETTGLDNETIALLNYADIAFHNSDGLFDITTGVLRKAWNFKSQSIPTHELIESLMPYIGWQKIIREGASIIIPKGMQIDFGGIVKEYAADAVASYFLAHNVCHGLVDLGGDIRAIGPHPSGKPWQVGIRNPCTPKAAIAKIELSSGGVATSGNYERFISVNGHRYGHVLNPLTGWPVSGVSSVSVHADTCIVAGTASTIGLLKGPSEGKHWLNDLGVEYVLQEE